jgi:hypothetical protein
MWGKTCDSRAKINRRFVREKAVVVVAVVVDSVAIQAKKV